MQQQDSKYLNVNDELLLSLSDLLYVRKCLYENNWHSNLHTHTHAEMFYVTEGKGSFLFDMQSCNVSAGDFLIINAHVRHTEVSSNDCPLGYIVLAVSGLETLCDQDDNNSFVIIKSDSNKQLILPLINSMLYEAENPDENSKSVCDYLLKALLLRLLRSASFSAEQVHPVNKKLSNECSVIRRYIDAHFKTNLSLDDLSKYAHISKYYMVHTFKKEYGISPMRYLQYKRITESKHLLEETQISISEIASILGFSSASQFTQCFKRFTSITPLEFRKQSQESLGN